MDFLLDDAIFSKNLDAENKLLQEYVKLAREQTDEFAFAIVYFKDGTKK